MWQHLISTSRAGLRSHSLRIVIIIAAALIVFAYLASSFSARHPHTVALDIGLSGSRIVLALLAIFWVQELVAKELDRRTVYFSLAYPLGRGAYWLGRYAGIAVLLAVATFVLALALYILVTVFGSSYHQAFTVHFGGAFIVVMLGQLLDALTIAAFCMLISSVSTTALMPLVTGIAFTLISRSFGMVVSLLMDPNGGFSDSAAGYMPLIRSIGFLFPDLGGLDLREMVLYGRDLLSLNSALVVWQVSAYLALLLSSSTILFGRREFQ